MMTMKMKIALVACVLLVSSLAIVASDTSVGPEKCCFSYYSGRLKKSNVISVTHTNRMCPKPGVILTTVNGVNVCVNPSLPWVKKIIEENHKELLEN